MTWSTEPSRPRQAPAETSGRGVRPGAGPGGLVLSGLSSVLAVAAAIGVTTFLNKDAAVTRMEKDGSQLRDKLPTDVNVDVN